MDKNEFLAKRKQKQFTWKNVEDILKSDCHYKTEPISTGLTQPGKWTPEQVKAFRTKLKSLKLPYFAYIKFYCIDGEKYALVAGKTNSWRDDIYFEKPFESYQDMPEEDIVYERKDKAKKWLAAKKKEGAEWYCEEVLLVYLPESVKALEDVKKDKEAVERLKNLALSIEHDISGLFGLFSS